MNKIINFSFLLIFSFFLISCPLSAQESPETPVEKPENDLSFDWNLSYSHNSNNRLVVNGVGFYEFLLIGTLQVRKIKRDIITPTLTINYGSEKQAFEMVIPYKMRRDAVIKYVDGGNEDGETELKEEFFYKVGLGDIKLNFYENTIFENTTAIFGVKTKTGYYPTDTGGGYKVPLGTGHYSVKAGLTHMFQSNPVLLFGGITHFWNLPWNLEKATPPQEIDPGDTIQYSLGMAYAINQKLSFKTQLEHSITRSTEINGEWQRGTAVNTAVLSFGGSYALKDSAVDLSIGIGLTEDSPDLSISLSRPFSF